jgi:hypothetical protein
VQLGRVAAGDDPAEDRQLDHKAITVKELCARYLADLKAGLILGKGGRPKKASTIVTDTGRIERHIIPLIGAGRSETFQLALSFATLLAFLMPPAASQAYTQDEEAACSGDAFRLCGPEIPDVDRVTACMVRNKSQLSPGCRVYFRPGPEDAAVATAGTPMSIKPATARKPAGSNTTAKTRKTKRPKKPAAT